MADYDRRPRGGGGGYNSRKRRYRGEQLLLVKICPHVAEDAVLKRFTDDDDFDRRPQRRRYEEPLSVKIRKQLLSIAESPLKRVQDEVHSLAKIVSDNYDDIEVRNTFFDLALQIIIEQPFKIPFVAATVVVLNGLNRGEEAVGGRGGILQKICEETEEKIKRGEWRDVKLFLRFLACLQGILEEEGVFVVLTELFERAVDLQTASSDDVSLEKDIRARPVANLYIKRH